MLILGEIADKYPTILGLWGFMLIPTLIALAIGAWDKWSGTLVLLFLTPACIWWAYGSYDEAYHEPIADAIQHELGTFWIFNSIASTFLPVIAVATAVAIHWHIHIKKKNTLRLRAFA